MKGIIIENSLKDKSIITEAEIIRTWEDGSWKLREVKVSTEWAEKFGGYLNDGPWYVHFWESDSDDVLVVFKDKSFWIKHSDKNTWQDAIAHGKSLHIPVEQLDFPID
ncbi:MAG TPA: hypothetical protein VHD55_00725 [Candidatus Paceibacterota bacterium]|nr:hypothetical protein [Candidatus Paceibacterota bacterium]